MELPLWRHLPSSDHPLHPQLPAGLMLPTATANMVQMFKPISDLEPILNFNQERILLYPNVNLSFISWKYHSFNKQWCNINTSMSVTMETQYVVLVFQELLQKENNHYTMRRASAELRVKSKALRDIEGHLFIWRSWELITRKSSHGDGTCQGGGGGVAFQVEST